MTLERIRQVLDGYRLLLKYSGNQPARMSGANPGFSVSAARPARMSLRSCGLRGSHHDMAGLVPAIHVLLEDGRSRKKDVDARVKPGHDAENVATLPPTPPYTHTPAHSPSRRSI
jgi:hypothetical protein